VNTNQGPTTTSTCAGLSRQNGGLLFMSCGTAGDISVPAPSPTPAPTTQSSLTIGPE
jgi:hypothetical protein